MAQSTFRSAALFTFRPGTSDAQIDAVGEALSAFVHGLDGLVDFATGRDLHLREGTDDFAVIATFESEETLRTYLTHPDHAEIVARLVAPIVASKHNVQIRVASSSAVA